MAGRAGRRGLDPVGTVIIACWDDVSALHLALNRPRRPWLLSLNKLLLQ